MTEEEMKEVLKTIYRDIVAIQRMSSYAPIGFRCSLIRATISLALPKEEARQLYAETKAKEIVR